MEAGTYKTFGCKSSADINIFGRLMDNFKVKTGHFMSMVMVIFGSGETEELSLGQQKLKDLENNWVLKDSDRVWL